MTTRAEMEAAIEARVQAAYEGVPEYVKGDMVEAALWARETMTRKEGEGHDFHITAARDGMVVCSFAKPEWGGDHCSRPMETGAEAMVMAVCEYLNGM